MFDQIINYFKSLILFITGLTLSIFLVIITSPVIFSLLIKPLELSKMSEVSNSEIMNNFLIILNYLVNPLIRNLNLPNFIQSPEGLNHFYDVKKLFFINNLALIIGLVISLILIKKINNKKRWLTLRQSIHLFSFLPLILAGLLVFFDFNKIFIIFHKILFHNSNWIFNPDKDPVINIMPEDFFKVEIILFVVIFLAILVCFNCFLHFKVKKELLLNNSMDITISR